MSENLRYGYNVSGICDVAVIVFRQPKYLMQPNRELMMKLRASSRHIANTHVGGSGRPNERSYEER